ncbi:hypothetical protein B0T17DRAFT_527486 [Bombardia bombarda]|uniref:Uncharacterized protein n=1 Tax=Bombardia bombarda TaxID=252184 RepID=A0AA39XAH0_9PEZI|nr:hypothetical protein B0T17DRAFT_527486 [Bombardia bombarda]
MRPRRSLSLLFLLDSPPFSFLPPSPPPFPPTFTASSLGTETVSPSRAPRPAAVAFHTTFPSSHLACSFGGSSLTVKPMHTPKPLAA